MTRANDLAARVAAIHKSNPHNLMARYFRQDWFKSLGDEDQGGLRQVIASGLANPDSSMGAYAMRADDYERFGPMLDPMIRAAHAIGDDVEICQQHDWDTSAYSCDLAAVDPGLADVSMRVRVARNLADFALPGAMGRDDRLALETVAAKAFGKLADCRSFGGQYLSITPGSSYEITPSEYARRVADHQMFKDMSGDRFLNAAGISSDWPFGRGMYVSRDEDFLVWVGEEDHLRIMSMMCGGNLTKLFERLHEGLHMLEQLLPAFARSPSYGYVTSCPTNLGAGMRASLHMKLPRLTQKGRDLSRVKDEAKKLGLSVRGAAGEHSDAGSDGLVDVSPTARLGVSEMQIMQNLFDGAVVLWKLETQ